MAECSEVEAIISRPGKREFPRLINPIEVTMYKQATGMATGGTTATSAVARGDQNR